MRHFQSRGSFQFNGHLLIGRIREMSLDKKIKFLSCPQGGYLRVFWSSPISRFQILSRNAIPKLRSGTPSLGLLPAKSQSLLYLGQEHEKNETKLAPWKNTAEEVLLYLRILWKHSKAKSVLKSIRFWDTPHLPLL